MAAPASNANIISDNAPQPVTAPPQWKPLADYLSARAPSLTLQGIRFWKVDEDAEPLLAPVLPEGEASKPKSFDGSLAFTCMVGGVACSYDRLKQLFGEPHDGASADDKSSVNWHFVFEKPDILSLFEYAMMGFNDVQQAYVLQKDQTIREAPFGTLTLYDYKVGKPYCGESGKAVEDIGCWHVGGHAAQADTVLAMMRKIVSEDGKVRRAPRVMNVMETYRYEMSLM